MSVRVEDGAMVVRPIAQPTVVDLKVLLRSVKKTNLHGEVQTGPKRGREVW